MANTSGHVFCRRESPASASRQFARGVAHDGQNTIPLAGLYFSTLGSKATWAVP